jgi:hypothetical protein
VIVTSAGWTAVALASRMKQALAKLADFPVTHYKTSQKSD